MLSGQVPLQTITPSPQFFLVPAHCNEQFCALPQRTMQVVSALHIAPQLA
jgi:hypothetical protein